MNDRLRELYRSCRPKEALASQDQYKSADVLLGTEVAKFAELIVQECITELETSKRCDPYTGDLLSCEYNNGIDYQIEMLKEHFGVK